MIPRIGPIPDSKDPIVHFCQVWFFSSVVLMAAGLSLSTAATAQTTKANHSTSRAPESNFFERKVRPLLEAKCLECHSHKTELNGGLSLDSKHDWSHGGDSGPAIDEQNWEKSLVWNAIGYQHPKLQMPPKSKLSTSEIDVFRDWLSAGAFDPRESIQGQPQNKSRALSIQDAQTHWAYRSFRTTEIPTNNVQTIDSFLEHQYKREGIEPSSLVELSTFHQRLSLDLHGLRRSVISLDSETDDYASVVDRYLASPQFGERMARRWMDVVRFAESVTLRGFLLPDAWRYRNYLIESFNADKSYDAFVREQIAGDLMASMASDGIATRAERLTATTMLALGDTNLEEQDKKQLEMDFVDEQLDTIGKVFLAQTIGCARCHDHKFDPIPTSDYYALAGILKSSVAMDHANISKWVRVPLPLSASEEERYEQLAQQQKELQNRVASIKGRTKPKSKQQSVRATDLEGIVIDDEHATKIGSWTASTSVPSYVGDGYLHDGNSDKGLKSISYEPKGIEAGEYRVRLSYTHGPNRSKETLVRISSADGDEIVRIDQTREPLEGGLWITLGTFRFESSGQAFVIVSNEETKGHVVVDAVQFLPESSIPTASKNRTDTTVTKDTENDMPVQVVELEEKLKELQVELDQRPMVMSLRPSEKPSDLAIHVRGSVHQLGTIVPRGFLTAIVTDSKPSINKDSNGRLELADWLASAENPLTGRVYVNRVWYWMMGEGLVRTVDNFGTSGESPSNEALLNWLTNQFIDHGWSTKWLVRQIAMSKAYRRDSRATDPMRERDPDNRTFARSYVRRLDAESLRDSLLHASGDLKLDERPASLIPTGLKDDFGAELPQGYRAIYGPWFRNSLPDLYAEFDGASPCVSVSKRTRSTIAQQSLALLNSPFVLQRAQRIAEKLLKQTNQAGSNTDQDKSEGPDKERMVYRCFELLLLRHPTQGELDWALSQLDRIDEAHCEQQVWAEIVQDLIASVDFRFVE